MNSKIKKAFCPPGVVEGNPVIVYIEHIVLPWTGRIDIKRPDSAGGNRQVPWFVSAAIVWHRCAVLASPPHSKLCYTQSCGYAISLSTLTMFGVDDYLQT